MIWWTTLPSRARAERVGVAELEERSPWLRDVVWQIEQDGRLRADFEIDLPGAPVRLAMTYPSFFPDMPPQVTSRDGKRLSGHQWGAAGELCLEYRPDNWDPSYTGAMMVESAHRLLLGEAPDGAPQVASAHRITQAQHVRKDTLRFMLPQTAASALANVAIYHVVEADIVEQLVAEHWIAFPRRVWDGDAIHWDATGTLPDLRVRTGFFVRLEATLAGSIAASYEFCVKLADAAGRDDLAGRVAACDDETIILVECGGSFRLVSLATGSGPRAVFDYRTVLVPASPGPRLPPDHARLSATSVAIVGCGSMGSKVAASLARCGVGRLVLVDGDLMLGDNVVRNDLDWRAVGLNKPDGVADRVRAINPAAVVTSRRMDVGGQESSDTTDAALVDIGGCDVIVDATADPQVFNLCGAAARNERRVLVWGEVFAGGIGGLVARLRPGIEPVPHAARRQVLGWCAAQGRPPPAGRAAQYGLIPPVDAPPLIADDGDVTVIAGHVTRLVVDALAREDTLFPQPAYAVGLRAGWIFAAPFETWPIELEPEGDWGPPTDGRLADELDAMVREFFPAEGGDAAR